MLHETKLKVTTHASPYASWAHSHQQRSSENPSALHAKVEAHLNPNPSGFGRGGFPRQPENSKRAHFKLPPLQKPPPKFHEKTHRERQKEQKWWLKRGKKVRNFGPHPSAPHFFWVWAPSPLPSPTLLPPLGPTLRPHPSGPHHDTHQIPKWTDQNWIGQNWSSQDQNGIGLMSAPSSFKFPSSSWEHKVSSRDRSPSVLTSSYLLRCEIRTIFCFSSRFSCLHSRYAHSKCS